MGFSYRMTITVTSNSSLLPSTQTNYPLYVDVTDPVLKTVANGGAVTSDFFAYDVVAFSDAALTSPLDFEHEIDTDNGYAGAASGRWRGWVKIPSLALGTVFYLGIGNAAITTQQGTPSDTWDADFMAVYHLAAKPSLGHGADSTVNTNNGTPTGTTDNDSTKLLTGLNFDGTTAEVFVADDATLQLGTGDLTISAWVNSSDTTKGATQQNTIVSKDFSGVELLIYEGTLAAYIGGTSNLCQGDDILSDNTWYYVAVTRSGSSVKTLINGVVDGTATNSADADNVGVDVYFGRRSSTGSADQRLVGILDEVRISDVARSDDWLKIDFNSQNDPDTFVSFDVSDVSGVTVNPVFTRPVRSNLTWR